MPRNRAASSGGESVDASVGGLIKAIKAGNVNAVNDLLDSAVDPNKLVNETITGQLTPLHFLAGYLHHEPSETRDHRVINHRAILDILLENGANIRYTSGEAIYDNISYKDNVPEEIKAKLRPAGRERTASTQLDLEVGGAPAIEAGATVPTTNKKRFPCSVM